MNKIEIQVVETAKQAYEKPVVNAIKLSAYEVLGTCDNLGGCGTPSA